MKLLIPLLIIVLLAGMFFTHADHIIDDQAIIEIENNRVFLKAFDDHILLDRHLIDYEYEVIFLETSYLVTAYSPILGGTGKHYKVYIIDHHGKVWHDNELEMNISIEEDTLHIKAQEEILSINIQSVIDARKEDGADHKIEALMQNDISASDVGGFSYDHSTIYLSYEIRCLESGVDLAYIKVSLDEAAEVLKIEADAL